MKKFTLLAVLVAAYSGYAQTSDEREKIVGSYDAREIQKLITTLEQKEKERVARVALYLEANPNLTKQRFEGAVLYEIYDVINGKPILRSTDNINSARAAGANHLHSNGSLGLNLEGQNMTVGVWDGGWARRNHVEYMNDATPAVSRVSFGDTTNPNPTTTSDHGTHVTGTICAKGVNPDAKGMAPKSFVKSYNWDNDEAEVTTAAGTNGLLISNHSYGVPTFVPSDNPNATPVLNVPAWMPGSYTSTARDWDQMAVNMPYYLQVASAGNNGDGSYAEALAPNSDKLIGEKVSKNNLVVANASPNTLNPSTGMPFNITMNNSSSQGPSDDLRVKPDIAADGTNVTSTIDTSNSAYGTYSGTSMASPTTAGSLILLQQYYNSLHSSYMRSATLKGLVCHTAFENALIPGPTPRYGWGMLRVDSAAKVITADNNNTALIMESTLNSAETYTLTFTASSSANLKATLCWTDPAGIARSNTLNSPLPALVNDLDLRITNGTTTYLPWKLQQVGNNFNAVKADNTVDNVEVVAATTGTSGSFTLTVSHKGTLTGGNQPFSLILTGTDLALSTVKNTIKDVAVWPNPARDILNIQFESGYEDVKMSLWDISGRTVYQTTVGSTDAAAYQIPTANLAKGMYILNIESGNLTYSKKIVVE